MQNYEVKLITPSGEAVPIKEVTEFKLPEDYQCEQIKHGNIQGSFTFEMPYKKTSQRKMYEHQQRTGRPQRVLIAEPMPWE